MYVYLLGVLGHSKGDSRLSFRFSATQATADITAEVFFISKSSTALSISTGMEVARGNNNIHSWTSHMMKTMMMIVSVLPTVTYSEKSLKGQDRFLCHISQSFN